MRDERFKFIFLMGIHIFILELLIMEHFINGTNLTEMSFKIPSGRTDEVFPDKRGYRARY